MSCVFAMIGAIARTFIRFRNRQLRILDDALLLFACLCLVAATILLTKGAPSLYLVEQLQLNPEAAASVTLQQTSAAIIKLQRYGYTSGILTWFSVFAVKFCYLSFFRQLIDRVSRVTTYWRLTLAVTCVACVFNVCSSFIACPKLGASSRNMSLPVLDHQC